MTTAQPAFWERASFRAVAEDGTWRPGGLATTRRALDWCEERGLLAPGALVADCGCGAGATLGLLAERGYRAVGLDRRIEMGPLPEGAAERSEAGGASQKSQPHLLPPACIFRRASDFVPCPRKSRATPLWEGGFVVQADISRPPLAPACADMLLFECVLSLLDDPGAALLAAREYLKPNGLCLVSDLTLRQGEPTTASGASCLSGARPEAEWRGLLKTAGFCILLSQDQSRALVELAAKMVWYGGEAGDLSGGNCACDGTLRRYGYGLWIARKNECLP